MDPSKEKKIIIKRDHFPQMSPEGLLTRGHNHTDTAA